MDCDGNVYIYVPTESEGKVFKDFFVVFRCENYEWVQRHTVPGKSYTVYHMVKQSVS